MRKIVLSLAFVTTILIGSTACNSTRTATDSTDSTMVDSTKMMSDTMRNDTTTKKIPDTTRNNGL